MKKMTLLIITAIVVTAGTALAGEAAIIKVKVTDVANRVYNFDVTVKHSDEGWNHFADAWDVLAPDGKVLATRTLHHPHVNEQPFTRSLSNVKIPDSVKIVYIRAHDSVHGYGTVMIEVDLRTFKTRVLEI